MAGELFRSAQTLWHYMNLAHQAAHADVILILGSNDLRVAEYGATLYHQGVAPLIVCSGAVGRLTHGVFSQSEADAFAQVLRENGVPESAILREPRATNTGENIAYSRALLAEKGIAISRVHVLQKPYAERRAYAAVAKQWPGVEVTVSSPAIAMQDYPTDEISFADMISALVADMERIRDYPAQGFQLAQPIPDTVHQALQVLKERGF
uniref:YdcF family protein n=1 Tax=Thaumasiovibrio occultus TaxID=1891184 RepID=UPI000B3547F3|nr:YdcF family protein [Thaumasiovibrio occultus]